MSVPAQLLETWTQTTYCLMFSRKFVPIYEKPQDTAILATAIFMSCSTLSFVQRHDVIKRNTMPSNVETVKYLRLVVYVASDI